MGQCLTQPGGGIGSSGTSYGTGGGSQQYSRAAQESQRQTFKAHIDELLRRVVLLPWSLALLCFILSQRDCCCLLCNMRIAVCKANPLSVSYMCRSVYDGCRKHLQGPGKPMPEHLTSGKERMIHGNSIQVWHGNGDGRVIHGKATHGEEEGTHGGQIPLNGQVNRTTGKQVQGISSSSSGGLMRNRIMHPALFSWARPKLLITLEC